MTPAGRLLRDEILSQGPVPFRRFMEIALYHPEFGYYRRRRDPFGAGGDYYTASQLQPVYGELVAERIRQLHRHLGSPADFCIVELGPGRGEMAAAFSGFRYYPVEAAGGEWPESFAGVVFCNEFFDALPVEVAVRRGGGFRNMLVGFEQERFVWVEGPPVSTEQAEYLGRYAAAAEEGAWVEINLEALRWVRRIASRLRCGFVFAVDYGYTAKEIIRYPRGTLMSYRRHVACEDVLADPGEQDITAHICFTALEDCARECGFQTLRFESLARTLSEAGEPDGFAAALRGATPAEQLRRRLLLKQLLFGMGEIFRTLILERRSGAGVVDAGGQ